MSRATLAVLILGLAWRTLRYALAFPLWGDEAFLAVNFLTRDFAGLWKPLEFNQIAPPGFLYAELAITRYLGSGEWALRLLPFLAGVGSLLLFRQFAQRVATRRVELVAVALLAASFFPVRHGNEVKPYTVDLLISMALTSFGYSVWRDPRSRGRWLALAGTATAGVWCSYPAIFPASGVAIVLVLRALHDRSRRLMVLGGFYGLLVALSFVTLVVAFAGPQSRANAWLSGSLTWADAFPPIGQPWRVPYWLLEVHTGSMMAYPHGTKNFGCTPTFLLVVAGAVAMARRRPRRALLLLLLAPVPVALAAAALHRYPYGTAIRVSIYLAPAICLLAAEGVVALLKPSRLARRGPLLIAGLLALVPVGFVVRDVMMPYTWEDDAEHRRIVQSLADQTRPGDRWIVFNGETAPSGDLGDVMISRWIQRMAEVRFYLLSLAPVPVLWNPDPRSVKPLEDGRTWLIVHCHGRDEIYPYQRLTEFQRGLVERIGWPRAKPVTISLADREKLNISVFEPAAH